MQVINYEKNILGLRAKDQSKFKTRVKNEGCLKYLSERTWCDAAVDTALLTG